MIIINNDNFIEDEHIYLFPGQFPSGRLPEGISISYQEYRYENEYVADKHAALSALLEISRCSALFAGMKLYAVVGESMGRPTGRVRSYKGWIPHRSPLKHLEHRRLEVFLSEKSSKLGAVFSISNPIPISGAESMLDFMNGTLVMSTLDIDGVCALATHWLSGEREGSFSLDYDKIGKDLVENENLLIIRLFGAFNRSRERVIVAYGSDRHSHQIHSFLSSLAIV